MLDPFKRYQTSLTMEKFFPKRIDGKCSCGCGAELLGLKRKWSSDQCRKAALRQFHIIKGDVDVIRESLFELDKGVCRICGFKDSKWEADHILPVSKGGGGCTISNFQTLCGECHQEKTSRLNRRPNGSYILAASIDIVPTSLYT